MSTVIEIENAIRKLSAEQRREVLLFVAESLRSEGELPEPREFSDSEMRGWMDEDEADLRRLRGST